MKDKGVLFHLLAPVPTLAFVALGILREANQNGGIAGMGAHSWDEALSWGVLPFIATMIVVAIVDLRRGK